MGVDGEGAHFGDEPFLMRHGDIDAEVCVVPLPTLRASGRFPRPDAQAAIPLRKVDRAHSLVVYISYVLCPSQM